MPAPIIHPLAKSHAFASSCRLRSLDQSPSVANVTTWNFLPTSMFGRGPAPLALLPFEDS